MSADRNRSRTRTKKVVSDWILNSTARFRIPRKAFYGPAELTTRLSQFRVSSKSDHGRIIWSHPTASSRPIREYSALEVTMSSTRRPAARSEMSHPCLGRSQGKGRLRMPFGIPENAPHDHVSDALCKKVHLSVNI